jgi:outer membrane protein assembly factor BamB
MSILAKFGRGASAPAVCVAAVSLYLAPLALPRVASADWPMWGRDGTRNMVSPDKNPPTEWDVKSGKNIKWRARLGSQSYGNPVVSGGLVFVGTNNEGLRDPKLPGDGSCLLVFRESDGEFLWQHHSPKLKAGRVNDWPFQGVCCSPMVEGDRVWFCTPRCEVVCLDVKGLKGHTGPGPVPADRQPKTVWKLDMMADLGVFPHNMTSCSIGARYKGHIYVITGNGVDESHKNIPSPKAPSLVCLEGDTGKVVWTDSTPGENILHGQWASPLVAEIDGRAQCIAPQGDGWIRSFDALTGKLIWAFDSNNKNTVYPTTRNELIGTPVLYENRIYIANGQDPEHGEGPGHLWCIDPTKTGDISKELPDGKDADGNPKGKPNPNSGVIWDFERTSPGETKGEDTMHRTISTVTVADGLAIAPDFSGFVHVLDAKTGKKLWSHDMLAAMWGSALVCDGKIYIGDEDGDVCVFALSREKKLLGEFNLGAAVYCSPVYANGVMYLMNREKLFAIQTGVTGKPEEPAEKK